MNITFAKFPNELEALNKFKENNESFSLIAARLLREFLGLNKEVNIKNDSYSELVERIEFLESNFNEKLEKQQKEITELTDFVKNYVVINKLKEKPEASTIELAVIKNEDNQSNSQKKEEKILIFTDDNELLHYLIRIVNIFL
ncbi:hypothetical protein [Gloeothece verrucosa]|uniref:Uncharacterized protein n=1 Tax=Gloeothece verrucosa (strain PCC 7822) TaxID=497965 RepID=E0UET5_GLOV7|nr:hypothetical protein [Gloeothece verrucosa]ADN13065.1 hypothetical protein Cyan7822_1056 [Gloeothece verrucosa PCC 7822]